MNWRSAITSIRSHDWRAIRARGFQESSWGLALFSLAVLFVVLVQITAITGNIMAWGLGWDSDFERMVCQSTYNPGAYTAFMVGLWLVAFVACCQKWAKETTARHTSCVLVAVVVTALISVVFLHAILFRSEDSASAGVYWEKMVGNAYREQRHFLNTYIVAIPLGVAVGWNLWPQTRRLPGTRIALFVSLLLVVFSYVLDSYRGHLFLWSISDPGAHDMERLLFIAWPFLALGPAWIYEKWSARTIKGD